MSEPFVSHIKPAFLLALFVGSGVILSAPFVGRGLSVAERVGIPILVATTLMIAYGIFIWMRSRTPYSSDADADSFYYLGFIYTLISLTSQLVPQMFPKMFPLRDLGGNELLGIFGLGLLTTFFGLGGRIAFLNFTPDSHEAVDGSLERMATNIDRVSVDIEYAMRRTVAGIEEFSRSSQVASDDLHAKAKLVSEALSQTATNVQRGGEAIEIALSGSAQKLTDGFVNAISDASTTIQKAAESAGDSLTSAIGDVHGTVKDANAKFKQLAGTTLNAAKALEAATSQLGESGTKLQLVVSSSVTQSEEAHLRIAELGKTVTAAQSLLVVNMKELAAHEAQLAQNIDAVVSRLNSLSGALDTADKTGTTLLKGFGELQQQMAEIAAESERQLATIGKHRQALEEELAESRSAVTKVHRELVDVVNQIRRELK